MYRAKCQLKSISPISFSRRYEDKAPKDEDPWEHEEKTWRGKLHVNGDDECIIPAVMFKNAFVNAARLLGERVGGKKMGPSVWKRCQSGVIVENDLPLGIKKDEVDYEDIFVDSQGGGGGAQVLRRFPVIKEWSGEVSFLVVLDSIIHKRLFERYLKMAGQIAGLGRYRPERGGNKGRFVVKNIEFEDVEV